LILIKLKLSPLIIKNNNNKKSSIILILIRKTNSQSFEIVFRCNNKSTIQLKDFHNNKNVCSTREVKNLILSTKVWLYKNKKKTHFNFFVIENKFSSLLHCCKRLIILFLLIGYTKKKSTNLLKLYIHLIFFFAKFIK